MIKNKLVKMLLVGLIAMMPVLVNLDETTLAQTQPQPFDLTSHFLGKTAVKFDTVLFEPIASEVEAVTGQILNAELSFRLDGGQVSTIKTSKIAALVLDAKTGKMQIVLQDGQRQAGDLLTKLEIAATGVATKIAIAPETVDFVVFKGQLRHLSDTEFVHLLDRVRRLPTKRDVLVFADDAIFAGEVLNPHFKIKTASGQEETVMRSEIIEIVLGSPGQHQLKTRNGRLLTGTIQTEEVTLGVAGGTWVLATRALARVLFTRVIMFGGRVCGLVAGLIEGDSPCD